MMSSEAATHSDSTAPLAVVIEPSKGLLDLGLRELWQYRELLYFFVWREIKVRYKQTAIGVAWVVLQPVLTVAIFTVVFTYFARVPSGNVPYPAFAFAGLVPWSYFSRALSSTATSLVADSALVQKVYFPRLALPLASSIVPLADVAIAFLVMQALLLWYGILPNAAWLALPFYLALAGFAALAIGLWLAPINVRYRDVGHALPFLVQMWMFASPVVYPAELVPARWQGLYYLNPVATAIGGFRWALLGAAPPRTELVLLSVGVVAVVFVTGLFFFRRMEQTFADVI
jgi:lipopolysaccharide transport system permease protein